MLERAYGALKNAGVDVRLAPLHSGVCSTPYCVIYEGACEAMGRSIALRHVLADVLVPAGQSGLLQEGVRQVRGAMETAGFRCAASGLTEVLEDYRAVVLSLDFIAPCEM